MSENQPESAQPPETPLDPDNKSGHFVAHYPCWCGDLHYYESPTQRDDLRVGDSVLVIAHHGAEWPGEVVEFTGLTCDFVIRWTGVRPSFDDRNTVCRKHVREVRVVSTSPGAGESA